MPHDSSPHAIMPYAVTTHAAPPHAIPRHATVADRHESQCLAALDAAIIHAVASGSYTTLTTPRALPYLIAAAVALVPIAVAAWCGLFHATARSSFRLLVALIVPALIITVPFQPSGGSTGFDQYAGGRAIAIRRDILGPDGAKHLHGLDERRRTITISDDEFGSWYEHIDHNARKYEGYRVHLTGFAYRPSTLGTGEFVLSRQFMSCCILDMTPFGFTVHEASSARTGKTAGAISPHDHDWITVDATIAWGSSGTPGHETQGPILQVTAITAADAAPTGYFYRA